MPKDWTAQISHVNFRCGECRKAFEGAPDLVEDDADQVHHPYRYFAHCPHCGARHQPQASWERALLKAHQHSTGPKTPEGVAAVTANLEGHPTPHETLRTRFNAMKHGATARTATYFPAKAGGYAFCARCDVDRDWCSKQPACVKQTEIFMLHHAALMATLQMCIQEVLGLGVLIKAPKVELDREGNPVTLTYTAEDGSKRYIYNYTSNPAFKPLTELISRLGLSMNDLGMTVRANDDEDEKGMGLLKLDEKDKETLSAFGQRMLQATENARGLIEQAQRATKADPVLVEHQARGGDK